MYDKRIYRGPSPWLSSARCDLQDAAWFSADDLLSSSGFIADTVVLWGAGSRLGLDARTQWGWIMRGPGGNKSIMSLIESLHDRKPPVQVLLGYVVRAHYSRFAWQSFLEPPTHQRIFPIPWC